MRLGMRAVFGAATAIVSLALLLPPHTTAALPPQFNQLVTRTPESDFPEGTSGTHNSATISANGRYVVYEYLAAGTKHPVSFFDDNTGGGNNLFIYDAENQETRLITHIHSENALGGTSANGNSQSAVISANSQFVFYTSTAIDLIASFEDDFNAASIYAYEVSTGINRLITHIPGDNTAEPNGTIGTPIAVSADGTKVAFRSVATDLVTGFVDQNDTNEADVYLYDTLTQTTRLVSHEHNDPLKGQDAGIEYYFEDPLRISADGKFIAYGARGTKLVNGFVNNNIAFQDLYLYDVAADTNTLITHSSAGPTIGSNGENFGPELAANGSRVAFETRSTTLVNGFVDNNSTDGDVFVWTRKSNKSRLVSFSAALGKKQGAGPDGGFNGAVPKISDNGKAIAYESDADDLMNGFIDAFNGQDDIWLWTEKIKKGKKVYKNSLVNFRVDDRKTSQFAIPTLWAFSGGGKHILYDSGATNVVDPFTNANGGNSDLYIYDTSKKKAVLVSHAFTSASTTSDDTSRPFSFTGGLISTDGRSTLYQSPSSNLVDEFVDNNGAPYSVYRFGP